MKISWTQLKHLPVQTETGRKIGMVEGVELDVDTHTVLHYEVKPGPVLLGVFTKSFLIAAAQVVSISVDVMVVKDTAVPATQSKKTRLAMATPEAELDMSELPE